MSAKTLEYFAQYVAQRLQGELPGPRAQMAMAHAQRLRELEHLPAPPDDARIACVLNLIHYRDGALRTVMIVRSANPRDRHSGQVSLPGGSAETDDADLERTALREAEEEIGAPAEHIVILGQLTALYIPVSNYLVHPFVGVLHGEAPVFRPQAGEVEAILTPPLAWFGDPARRVLRDIPLANGVRLSQTPAFDIEGRAVWGATAMIMNEFAEAAELRHLP